MAVTLQNSSSPATPLPEFDTGHANKRVSNGRWEIISLLHVEISLVKGKMLQIAGQHIFSKAVIQLTLEQFNCLKDALSTDTVFNILML